MIVSWLWGTRKSWVKEPFYKFIMEENAQTTQKGHFS